MFEFNAHADVIAGVQDGKAVQLFGKTVTHLTGVVEYKIKTDDKELQDKIFEVVSEYVENNKEK